MKPLFRSLIFIAAFVFTPKLHADTPIFDNTLVTDLAKAYLSAYFRQQPARHIELDYKLPTILAAVDGNRRQFIFVGYRTIANETEGATIVFEQCGINEIYPSHYGLSLDIRKDAEQFKAVEGNKVADYPGGCLPPP